MPLTSKQLIGKLYGTTKITQRRNESQQKQAAVRDAKNVTTGTPGVSPEYMVGRTTRCGDMTDGGGYVVKCYGKGPRDDNLKEAEPIMTDVFQLYRDTQSKRTSRNRQHYRPPLTSVKQIWNRWEVNSNTGTRGSPFPDELKFQQK